MQKPVFMNNENNVVHKYHVSCNINAVTLFWGERG